MRTITAAALAVTFALPALAAHDARRDDTTARLSLACEAPPAPRDVTPDVFAHLVEILPDGGAFVDGERALAILAGGDVASLSPETVGAILTALAEALPDGGAIDLPRSVGCGTLDFRNVRERVQITGGRDGTLVLGDGQAGARMLFCDLDLVIDSGPAPSSPRGPWCGKDVRLFDEGARPLTDLVALFCNGGIRIDSPVERCSWIAGANAFGRRTVTASAPVDDSLFLWFGINWPFQDYNAHLKNPSFDWKKNAQMWFDCKGGGAGTRCYLMIETNYGNPGPGVVLKNCKDMALYHGSTERASSTGPGVYWLKDCENVKLGVRRIFCALRHSPKAALPTHGITIEGGRGNILHNLECFANSQEASAVNSDPELQVWGASFDFETEGFDDALTFCFTPHLNQPAGAQLAAVKRELVARVEKKMKDHSIADTPEHRARVARLLRSGRDVWNDMNATREVTFSWGDHDYTRGANAPCGDRRLSPPPSMPATDAPRLRRAIAFTQRGDFGAKLIAAGADPTGKRPSDEAFAMLMYGTTRDELQELLAESYDADRAYRAARGAKDKQAMKAARARFMAVVDRLHPYEPLPAGKKRPKRRKRVRRPRLEIPAGTFLLERPLVLFGWRDVWGTGSKTTVLRGAQGNPKMIEQHKPGTLACFAVDGGRVGLAITGADHHDGVSPTLQSYVAGADYYDLAFRNQTFAGVHVGTDDHEVMGGAEYDQNRWVDVSFTNTGEYGVFMNQNMLDKWLVLHCSFAGQKKAGISVKFNNLIHGGFVGCTFRDIDGPGIDLMGGNPRIRFRGHQVMIDQCEFVECGNADAPAVDQGASVCMSFTRCRIVTRGKVVKTGYAGAGNIYEDVEIDVRTEEGAPAMMLRGTRQCSTGRANGHTLRNVRASGPVAFVNDANEYNEHFRKTCIARGCDPDLDWDTNAAAHELAPPNGWVHPFVFFRCAFGRTTYAYSLINADTDSGKVLREIDLSMVE